MVSTLILGNLETKFDFKSDLLVSPPTVGILGLGKQISDGVETPVPICNRISPFLS